MRLSNVLSSIRGEEKTANVSPAVPSSGQGSEKTASTTEASLKAALREATEAPAAAPTEKVAAAPASPVADLVKTANQMADAEHEALVKEAQFYGASVADGFMARLAQYDQAATQLGRQQPAAAKTAAATDDSFEKFASENPALVKQAAELGYATTSQQIEKLAEAAHVAGYNKAVESIYKVGHACFSRGFEDALRLVQGLNK